MIRDAIRAYKSNVALESIAENVWAAPMPHVYMGLHIGTRMTVVRLSDGSLFVHSPIALDESLKAEIDALGPVGHIVAPNLFHHVFFGDFAAAYPEAKTHAAPGLEEKRKDLTFRATLAEEADPAWFNDLDVLKVDGVALGETVFFHQPSRTLVSSDFIQNFDSSDHWPTKLYLKAAGIHGKIGVSRAVRAMYRDKGKARRSVDRAIEWNPARITLAHGAPILANAQEELIGAYEWLRG